ncbi:TolC family protein [Acetomicrobium sp.]|jgi:outer membrane protein TolC|uniref:TolC family protein n=1 Tax=Acetomicrobium sp. TaxID=1872099 RepID=UPI0016AE5CA0|nr:TolC family protein [Acetomicrobium sp.]NLI42974.1 TolC family protein [Synergistaceae bacterium]
MLAFCCLVFLVLVMDKNAWGGEVQTETKYNLVDLIVAAEEHNPLLRAAQEQANQARALELQSASQLAPKLDSSLSYLHEYGGGLRETKFRDTYKAALTLTHTLYSGDGLEASLRAATLNRQAVEADLLRTRQMVRNDVRKSYYDLQRARAQLRVAQESYDLALEHLKQAESLYKQGIVALNEVLRTKVDVSTAELNLIQAQNGTRVALSALEKAVGITLSFLQVPEITPEEEACPPLPQIDPYAMALQYRPELVSLDDSRKAAEELAKAAAGQARPNVYLQGEVFYYEDEFFPNEDDWNVSIIASWRLYDRGEVKNKIEENRAMARELLAMIDDLRNQIRLEVSTAWQNMESALQRVRVADDQVRTAEEDYRMALKRYVEQVGTNIDVLDSRTALTDANTSFVNAIYDAYSAYSDLIYAIGVMEEDFTTGDLGNGNENSKEGTE